MIQYLPYIFGTVSFLGGIWLFLFSFKIYEPNAKTEEQKERITKLHNKFGTFLKVISVFLIINGAYDLIARNPERYRIGEKQKTEWKDVDRQKLVNQCMKRARTSKKYPEITREYCNCTSDTIMSNMTFEEYSKVMRKPKQERMKVIKSVVEDCLWELRRKIAEKDNE